MERLTEKHYLAEDHYMKCSEDCSVDMDCVDCPAFDKLVERLAAYEDTGLTPEEVTAVKLALMGKTLAEITEFEGVPLDRLRELAEVDKDGRIRIIPESQNETCGHCYNFEREPGTKHGTCAKRPHPRDRYGKIDRSKQFIVSQSTQSCRLYMSLRSEAERAMEGGKDG